MISGEEDKGEEEKVDAVLLIGSKVIILGCVM